MRTYIITGASKGIGHATAVQLAKEGHQVIGLARSQPEDSAPFTEFVPVDLGDQNARLKVFEELAAKYRVDGILNNVGLVNPAPLGEITLDDFDAVIDMNLRVAIQLTQAVLPGMKERGWGRIVSTSSLVTAGVPFRTSYAAAKTALLSFTRSWALELAQFGITVNAVSPGPVATELFNTNNPPGSESRQRYIDGIPMKRTGTPEELAAANCFFLGESSSFVTGQNLYVDGGSSTGHAPI
ncbi:SDR family oxidoreductase [Haloferula chungangensis]|uniref:SDR family oxidoreductase n=1 Tax=Haloferula chungangensis TaxID=1048331 RepID=A0ABW2L7K9_9BACT